MDLPLAEGRTPGAGPVVLIYMLGLMASPDGLIAASLLNLGKRILSTFRNA